MLRHTQKLHKTYTEHEILLAFKNKSREKVFEGQVTSLMIFCKRYSTPQDTA